MRILHLTTFLQGGAGLAITSLARRQLAGGHAVVVVASRTAPEGYGNYPAYVDALAVAGVPFHVVDSTFYRDRTAHQRVLRFLREHLQAARGFDLIHTHAAVPSRIALRLAGSRRRPGPVVIQTMHGWGVRKTRQQAEADLRVLGRLSRVVVPSRASFDLLSGLGVRASRLHIVPYGVDPLSDPPDATRSNDPDFMAIAEARRSGRRVVCSIGTVGDRKNQRLLVETLASISETLRPLVVLVGEGDIAGITALAQARGVGALVRCTGYRSDARDILRAADCLVLPSRSEGLPLALLEAFCDRVPVVASDIPEFREVVADGVNGLLFAEGDVSALGAALERMFTMTAAQRHDLVGRAHEVQVERFRTSQMADAYMREYAGLLIPTRRDAGSSCAA